MEYILKQISLPKRYFDNDFVIADQFEKEKDRFLDILGQYNADDINEGKDKEYTLSKMKHVIDGAKKVSEIILDIFVCHEKADSKGAQELMDQLMEFIKDDIFVGSIMGWCNIKCGGDVHIVSMRKICINRFVRVRAVEYESENIQNNPDELFHIPLSKRAYAGDGRFSLAGSPSLYLSTNLALAWQECGYPQKYYYSEYNSKQIGTSEELQFLLLYSPAEIASFASCKYNDLAFWEEIVTRYLKTYPLVLACSFVNQSGNVPYKQEYIIPQMLMQWVKRNQSKIQGIEYFSCVDNSKFIGIWEGYNIVIPVLSPYDDKRYSEKLRKQFTWSEPKFYSVPVFDKQETEKDREFLYEFISDIKYIFRTVVLPEEYCDIIMTMLNTSGCLLRLLENEKDMDMQMIILTLQVLRDNVAFINNLQLDKIIEEAKNSDKNKFMSEEQMESSTDALKNLYHKMVSVNNGEKVDDIGSMIWKYEGLCWNIYN